VLVTCIVVFRPVMRDRFSALKASTRKGCIRHPSRHDSAARTLKHGSALINDKVGK